MAGALQTKETMAKVDGCICKECSLCYSKTCAGCENPITSRAGCITCYPHNPIKLVLETS